MGDVLVPCAKAGMAMAISIAAKAVLEKARMVFSVSAWIDAPRSGGRFQRQTETTAGARIADAAAELGNESRVRDTIGIARPVGIPA